MATTYSMCTLMRAGEQVGRIEYQVSWVPDKFATAGMVLKLKDEEGEWDDGWKVWEVSHRGTPSEGIRDREHREWKEVLH